MDANPRSASAGTLHAPRPALARDPSRIVVMGATGPRRGWSIIYEGLERALVARGVGVVCRRRGKVAHTLARASGRLGLIRPLAPDPRTACIAAIAWASDLHAWPDAYYRELVPWIYDCWGPQFDRWEALLRRHRVRTAFFCAQDAARELSARIPQLDAHWCPEACHPADFHPGTPLVQRSIHYMEMGRKDESIHERVRDPLAKAGLRHLYSRNGTKTPIFAQVDELYRALGDTVLLACFPKSHTHPQNAGPVSTMTQRYLEACASGCIPIGVSPPEIRDLFGFDPVIPISTQDPAGQLLEIARNPAPYQAHVDRSLARVRQVSTFDCRAEQMLSVLAARGA